jgi:hypothetical protein
MKLLLALSMVIFMVTWFFIFIIFSSLSDAQIQCSAHGDEINCDVTDFNTTIVVCVLAIGFFLIVDALSFYMIMKYAIPGLA